MESCLNLGPKLGGMASGTDDQIPGQQAFQLSENSTQVNVCSVFLNQSN